MDSFCDQPRDAPVPTSVEMTSLSPHVPEVSLIFQNAAANTVLQNKVPQLNENCMSYNVWKARKRQNESNRPASSDSNKENNGGCSRYRSTAHSLSKRQVKFEGSALRQAPMVGSEEMRPPLSNRVPPSPCGEEATKKIRSNLITHPFEQIYMSNIPNRHLDLSVIEPLTPARILQERVGQKANIDSETPARTLRERINENTKSLEGYQKFSPKVSFCNRTDTIPCASKSLDDTLNERHHIDLDYAIPNSILRNSTTRALAFKDNAVDAAERQRDTSALNDKKEPSGQQFSINNSQPETCTALKNHHEEYISNKNKKLDAFNSPDLQASSSRLTTEVDICERNFDKMLGPSGNEQTEKKSNDNEKRNSNNDPTVKDLLKIIQQQNEQLIILQKQVATLLETKSNRKQIEAAPINQQTNFTENCTTSTQVEPVNIFQKTLPKNCNYSNVPLPKFAIDVMTSFEVSIRQPQNFPHHSKFAKDLHHGPKIQEITETDCNVFEKGQVKSRNMLDDIRNDIKEGSESMQVTDESLTLNGSVKVQEESPSPEHSIQVDMQDYSSDSGDESSGSSTDVGWTIYNNVVSQVNNILKKTQQKSHKGFVDGPQPQCAVERITDKTRKVREATMRHLKSIGVSLPSLSGTDATIKTSDVGSEPEYSPTEISFAVKQLLMKYLPDKHLRKVAYKQNNCNAPVNDGAGGTNLIRKRPEFSFATLQYMRKYNLLNSGNDVEWQPEVEQQVITRPSLLQRNGAPKILDITALKQRPKLL